MSRVFSIQEVCERALRKIGAYAIRSSGARPEEVEETRYWLDMIVSHVSSMRRTWWLVPTTATFTLVAGSAIYDLNDAVTTIQAPSGIQFVIGAYLYDPVQQRDIRELRMARRDEYERIEDKGRQAEPEMIYVNRDDRPTATLYPVPDASRTYVVRLLFQSYSSDFTSTQAVDKTFKLRHSWNLWMVTELAHQIANGPVRKLPADEVRDMKDEAALLLMELQAYEDFEQAGEPRRVRYYNGI